MEKEVQYCNENPLINPCEKCSHLPECMDESLKFNVHVPQWFIDHYLPKLSRHAIKIILFLARRASFDRHSNLFGLCWATHEQIFEATGVPTSNMNKYLMELEDEGLITRTTSRRKKVKGHFTSKNTYTVTWFKRNRELNEKARRMK